MKSYFFLKLFSKLRLLQITKKAKSKVQKIFEGEILIRILPTTLLQIFCKIILYSKVINKSMVHPDDNFISMEEF